MDHLTDHICGSLIHLAHKYFVVRKSYVNFFLDDPLILKKMQYNATVLNKTSTSLYLLVTQ